MIISGGVNIYPAEIEGVLLTHPKVGDAAVFGIPHDDWGEEIKAVIEPAAGVTAGPELADEILSFCGDKLAKFKIPEVDRLHQRDAARPQRQALQAQAARPLLGRPRAGHLMADGVAVGVLDDRVAGTPERVEGLLLARVAVGGQLVVRLVDGLAGRQLEPDDSAVLGSGARVPLRRERLAVEIEADRAG